ncbi:MAG: hypothetical protein NZ699_16870 [Roseiflexus sp.]|nr:hypothetical protein [Roseiflexus sp.]MCS7290796.1 hypothetical protein [Roseiflexus sp.]MDW8232270.1 hypothetical protein [Roseiflexaceae bacterium]
MSTRFPHLSVPQRQTSARRSFSIGWPQRCGLTTVAALLAAPFPPRDLTPLHPLRDGPRTAGHTSGAAQGCARRDPASAACVAPGRRRARQRPPADARTPASARDAARLGRPLPFLILSVVIRSSVIPAAWHIASAITRGVRRPHPEARVRHLRNVTPVDGTALFLTDRRWGAPSQPQAGIRSCAAISRGGIAPPTRRTAVGCAPSSAQTGRPGAGRAPGRTTRASVGRRPAGAPGRWLRRARADVTDLPLAAAEASWRGVRAGIEGGSTEATRGGGRWEQTDLTDPQRAARLWRALALAPAGTMCAGCAAEGAQPGLQTAAPETRYRPPARQRSPRVARSVVSAVGSWW